MFIPILKQVEAQEGRVMCRRESCRSETGGAGSHDKPCALPTPRPWDSNVIKHSCTSQGLSVNCTLLANLILTLVKQIRP